MNCPICLDEIENSPRACPQCKQSYHTDCFDHVQCAVCRKVFDQAMLKERQKKLTDHHNEMVGSAFYDQLDEDMYESYEDEDDDYYYEDERDQDEEWMPTRIANEEIIFPRMVTRALAMMDLQLDARNYEVHLEPLFR